MTYRLSVPDDPAMIAAIFTVDGEPASKARARFTAYGSKVRTYTPAKTMQAEKAMALAFLSKNRASQTKQHEATYGVAAHFFCGTGQRRDVDNMLKLILDGLNGVAWDDDNQVIEVTGRKSRVPKDEARTEVIVYRIGVIEKPRGKCIRCGDQFAMYASTSARKFCTRACAIQYRKDNRARDCLNCQAKFTHAHPSHQTVYCSHACLVEHKSVELTCAECSSPFRKARSLARKGVPFCSDDCRTRYWRTHKTTNAKGECMDCGGPTSKKQYKRCRGCNHAAGGRWAA